MVGIWGLMSTKYRHCTLWLNGNPLLEKLSKIDYVHGKILKVSGRRRKMCNDNDNGNVEDTKAWYKMSILFGLEYWTSNQI